ncbi:MAG: efflux RND transporter periplasmic adaptor subunit [Negativicutes bacterium]|nr:efflux RND transporter periplasmic adaptor subunit [Negativicutes bacterium]
MRQRYRVIAILLAISIISTALFGFSHFGLFSLPIFSRQPFTVTVTSVRMMNKDVELLLPGTVEDRNAAIISAQISGHVSEVLVTEGQIVQAGQPLVSIDGVIPAEAGPTRQNEDMKRLAQSNYDNSQQEYNRYQKLYTQGAVARRQLDAAAARLQAAQDALSAAQTSRQPILTGQPQQSGRVSLVAPAGGTVTGLSAVSGKAVQAGQQLLVLQNGGEVRVVIYLQQKDLSLVRAGTLADITSVQAPGQGFAGRVEGIYPEIAPDRSSFRTHIQIDNADGFFKTGMAVRVRLNTDQAVTVRVVPATAITQEQGANFVYLAVDGKAVRQPVTIGAAIDDFIEITSDLPAEAQVITSGVNNLKDGTAVSIK